MSQKHDDLFQNEKLLDSDYDGIQELDNPLPRWWVWIFWVTILFSIVYIWFFWFGPGLTPEEKLAQAMKPAESKTEQAGVFDVSQVKPTPAILATGKLVYDAKCAACHTADGGGLVGPNLTDQYWVNRSGSVQDLYLSIDLGYPNKGMIAWGKMLTPEEMAATAYYIKSLQGTTPANGKAPEGTFIAD